MKIDVITLHRVRNYGSSLQTLAMQMFLKELGCEVEIIDYYPERYSSKGLLKRLKNKSKKLGNNSILLLMAKIAIIPSYYKKHLVFDDFLRKHINLTGKTYYSEADLKNSLPKADAYCTGSDQVWNSHWNEGVDRPFYLNFLPDDAYRFSYASSIGSTKLSYDEKQEVAPMLKKYSHISVREDSGVTIIQDMGISDVEQVLDPTLLFDAKAWNPFVSNRYENQKYVVTYNLHHDKRIDQYATKLADKYQLKVLNISYNWHDIIRSGHLVWCPTIEEYLGLIRDAAYVVTDSFHATAFSLIFGTKFIDIFPEQASARLRSILKLTNTENRGFDEMPAIDAVDVATDFDAVRVILKNERQRSVRYMNTILNELKNDEKYI